MNVEEILGDKAVWLVRGSYPEIIQCEFPDAVFQPGKEYILAVIPVDSVDP